MERYENKYYNFFEDSNFIILKDKSNEKINKKKNVINDDVLIKVMERIKEYEEKKAIDKEIEKARIKVERRRIKAERVRDFGYNI